jgi:hypothetical protein
VVVIDPRAVLEGRAGDVKSVTVRGVPPALVPLLSQVRHRLTRGVNRLPMPRQRRMWETVSRISVAEMKRV